VRKGSFGDEDMGKRARRSYGKQPRWTEEEEDVLRGFVHDYGTGNWEKIARAMDSGRTGAGSPNE
jgi:hypothetical protein